MALSLFSSSPKTQEEFIKAVSEAISRKDLKKFEKLLPSYVKGHGRFINNGTQNHIDRIVGEIDKNVPLEEQVDLYGALIKYLDEFYGKYLNNNIKSLPFINSSIHGENKLILGPFGLFAAVAKLANECGVKFDYKPRDTGDMKFNNELTALYIQNYAAKTNWNNSGTFWESFSDKVSPENAVKVFDNMILSGADISVAAYYIIKHAIIPYMGKYKFTDVRNKDVLNLLLKQPKSRYYDLFSEQHQAILKDFLVGVKATPDQLKQIKENMEFWGIGPVIDVVVEDKKNNLRTAATEHINKLGVKPGGQFGGIKADEIAQKKTAEAYKKAQKKIEEEKRLFKINSARDIASGDKKRVAQAFQEVNSKHPDMKNQIVKLAMAAKRKKGMV